MLRMVRLRVMFLGVVVVSAGFVWGYQARRQGIFPDDLLRSIARRTGLSGGETEREVMDGRAAPASDLFGLAYVDGTVDAEESGSGVLLDRREKPVPGLNLYSPRTLPEARLVDMAGQIRHRWSWGEGGWQHVHVFPDGSLLALVKDECLIKVDRDSNLLWRYDARVHHDCFVAADGTIYVLQRESRLMPESNGRIPTIDDQIAVLDEDGGLLRTISVTDAVLSSEFRQLLPLTKHVSPPRGEGAQDVELDILHTNHVEVFDGSLESKSPLFRRGNILTSMRTISSIAILSGETGEILWLWGPGNLVYQHDPTLLDDGHILIFNNGTSESQVLEIDPLGRKMVWEYRPGESFFSRSRGSVQRLANGNTLITESDRGHVREVTPDGEIVWRFACPDETKRGERVAIWRMTRIAPAALPFLDQK